MSYNSTNTTTTSSSGGVNDSSPVVENLTTAATPSQEQGRGYLAGVHCYNLTRLLNDYIFSVASNLTSRSSGDQQSSNGTRSGLTEEEEMSQRNALMYIVVVLFFYSFGIGIMMIKYMRKEVKEQEECKMYRRYINAAHEQYRNSTNRSRLANRLALQALNTVNAIPQTSTLGSKVTFV